MCAQPVMLAIHLLSAANRSAEPQGALKVATKSAAELHGMLSGYEKHGAALSNPKIPQRLPYAYGSFLTFQIRNFVCLHPAVGRGVRTHV